MYAELKSQNKLLVNRLDENEKILLKCFAENAKNKTITIEELTDESGDFGGIFLNLVEPENEEPSKEV